MSEVSKFVIDFLGELGSVFLELSFLFFDVLGDFVVHGDLPHLGLGVKLDICLPLSVEGFNLVADFDEAVLEVVAKNVSDLLVESPESVVHVLEFGADVSLHILELSGHVRLEDERFDLAMDGGLLLVLIGLEFLPSALDLLKLCSMLWSIELNHGFLEPLGDSLFMEFLVVSVILELFKEHITDFLQVFDVAPDLFLGDILVLFGHMVSRLLVGGSTSVAIP